MKCKRIIAIVLAVVAVAMVGFGIYTMNSSKYIFKKALSGVFSYAIDSYDEMTDELDELDKYKKYKLNTSNSLIMQGEEIASISGDMYIDVDKNNLYANIDSKIMSESFIGLEMLVEEEKMYIKVKEVMDKFNYEEFTDSDMSELMSEELEGLTDDEFKLLMNHLKDSILKDIGNKDLEKTSKTIKLGDKNYKTSKVSLKLTEKRLLDIVDNFLSAISGDKKAIQILQKYDKTITKESIEKLAKSIKESNAKPSTDEIFTLSFYVEGLGGLKRVEISTPAGDVDSVAASVSATLDIFKNKHKQNTYLLALRVSEIEIATLKVEYTTKTKANILAKLSEYEISGTYENTEKKESCKLSFIESGETLGTISYNSVEVTKDKEYSLEFELEIPGEMSVSSDSKLYIGENMPSIDTEDAVSIDELTDEEMDEIADYIDEKLESIGLPTGDDYFGTDDNYWDGDSSFDDEAYDTSYYEEISANEVKDLMNSEEPTVLWFGSQDCTYCAKYAEALEEAYWDYFSDIYYIDVTSLTDSDREILKGLDSKLNVTSTPTTFVFQNGEIKEVKTGQMTKDELYSFLDKNGVE
ncbi:MAG: thioredoxin family protein [Bacilli bacterium]|nr:thioredoxin family protein [Bacilli bacterium]